MWNNLPKDIVQAGSLTLFRNRLKDLHEYCIGSTSRISPFERYFYNFSFSFS